MALNYWGNREEQLTLQWLTAQTPKQQFKVHWQLEPKVLHMARQILYRYHNRTDPYLVQEAVDNVFIALKQHYNQSTKAYSYCQTIIRNHYQDQLVRPLKYEHQSFDEYPDMADEIQEVHENVMEECLNIEEAIKRRLKALYAKDEARLQSALKTGSTTTINDVQKYLPFIKYCIEYIERFGAVGTIRGICEYCYSRIKMTDVYWKKASWHVFEYDFQPHKDLATERYKERIGRFKKDYETPMQAFLDDIAPREYKLKALRKSHNKQRQSIYHDDNNN